jgi:hypothetical protein
VLENNLSDTGDFPSLDSVVPTPTLTPDELYWESDDINPNHVIYDLDNNEIIIPSEEEITTTPTPTPTEQPIIKKIVSRNVGNSRRRRIR